MDADFSFTSRFRAIVILIGVLVVFVLPYAYHVDVGPGPNGLVAILWMLPENSGIILLTALEYFTIYYLYRLVVLTAVWRYQQGKMKSRILMLHGLVAELIPVLISIPATLFLNSEGENLYPIMIPLPFLFLYCAVLVLSKRVMTKRNGQSHQKRSE
ncbi:MAG: hypothetical protein C4K48_03460 [Candidatus Thorarchaeota archaeon]|nr:MAG: hypothetical protein C4K48_03460 [Candidatus Thorarchaeota archaeon]